MKKESFISSIYLIIPLVTWNFKLPKALFRSVWLGFWQKIFRLILFIFILNWHKGKSQLHCSPDYNYWWSKLFPAAITHCNRHVFTYNPNPPALPQGQNSYPTCQHANMFGMFSHIHWKACDPTSKKMKVSYYVEAHFQEIKTVNQRDTLKLVNQICKILLFYIRYRELLKKKNSELLKLQCSLRLLTPSQPKRKML